MNYLFTKTALIPLLTIAMTACVSSQDAADIESKLSPTSESGRVSNLDVQNEEDTDADLIVQANNSRIEVDSLESERLLELQAEINTELSKRNISNGSETQLSTSDSTDDSITEASETNLETVALQPSSVNTNKADQPIGSLPIVPEKQADNIITQQETFNQQNSGIEEGQFVNNGFDDQLKVEIVKVKRIQNSETQQTEDTVVVKLRVKRLQENVDGVIWFNKSKARNVDTYEEYEVRNGKYTDTTWSSSIPLNAWAEAYFWLEVPRGIELIDIIFPETAIFKNVPIEG